MYIYITTNLVVKDVKYMSRTSYILGKKSPIRIIVFLL